MQPPAHGADGVDVSVVIPSVDGARWLEGCLPSVRAATSGQVEIVVADDGSTDESLEVCERFDARFLPSTRTRAGFAATANRGLRAASGRWVLLLNNDTELAPGAIDAMLATARRHPDAAMIAPLVLSLRDRETIDSAGMLIYPDGTARPRWHGIAAGSARLRGEEEVLVPSGAAAFIRREWLDRAGLLDERMGSYLEDIDLGLRIRRAGGGAIFAPDAVVYHHFSGTTGALSSTKARLIERNHITVAARHLPLRWLLALPAWTLARWVVMVRTVLTERGNDEAGGGGIVETGGAVIGGFAAGLAGLPAAIAQRRHRDAVLSAPEWSVLLRRHRARLADYRRFGV